MLTVGLMATVAYLLINISGATNYLSLFLIGMFVLLLVPCFKPEKREKPITYKSPLQRIRHLYNYSIYSTPYRIIKKIKKVRKPKEMPKPKEETPFEDPVPRIRFMLRFSPNRVSKVLISIYYRPFGIEILAAIAVGLKEEGELFVSLLPEYLQSFVFKAIRYKEYRNISQKKIFETQNLIVNKIIERNLEKKSQSAELTSRSFQLSIEHTKSIPQKSLQKLLIRYHPMEIAFLCTCLEQPILKRVLNNLPNQLFCRVTYLINKFKKQYNEIELKQRSMEVRQDFLEEMKTVVSFR